MKNKVKYFLRIRLGHLNNTNKNIFESKIHDFKILTVREETNVIWEKIGNDIKNIANDVFEVSKRKTPNNKNSWWWN